MTPEQVVQAQFVFWWKYLALPSLIVVALLWVAVWIDKGKR